MPPGEMARIQWLLARAAGSRPPPGGGRIALPNGDDAALWAPPPGHAAVLTVDAQVEGVHFRPGWLTPEEIGARAVAASASDLAAMAARPAGVLLAITLPRDASEDLFRRLFEGALAEARRLGLAVLGGNLSAGPLSVSVTALGTARSGEAVGRGGARPGDGLYVTGWPGRSRIGLAALLGKRARGGGRALRLALSAFRAPRPRIAEARLLARSAGVHALIDLSDGLLQDLDHLLRPLTARPGRAPERGATLDAAALEGLLAEGGCGALARKLGLEPLLAALSGGEDYELLLAAPPGPLERLAGRFRRRFKIPLTRVGAVERRPGIRIEAGGPLAERVLRFARSSGGGFDHFAAPRKGPRRPRGR